MVMGPSSVEGSDQSRHPQLFWKGEVAPMKGKKGVWVGVYINSQSHDRGKRRADCVPIERLLGSLDETFEVSAVKFLWVDMGRSILCGGECAG